MRIAANYISDTSFTVATDRTAEFATGVRVQADCGTDGTVLGTVTASSYASGSGLTTVGLSPDAGTLTANLAGVLHGNDVPASLANHGHTGPADGGRITGPVIGGSFRNLRLAATGTDSNVTITADELIVKSGAGLAMLLSGVSLTASTAATGAGGLDTGTIAASTWYAVWVIATADGEAAGLLSTSATALTLPDGYMFKARVGWTRTDATNAYPLGFTQYGHSVQYRVGASRNLTAYPVIVSGAVGSTNNGHVITLAEISVANFVPETASGISLTATGMGGYTIILCPNNDANFTAWWDTSVPPIVLESNGSSVWFTRPLHMLLESRAIFAATEKDGPKASVTGWEDTF